MLKSTTLKYHFLLISILGITLPFTYSQQEFKFGYRFTKNFISNNGNLYLVKQRDVLAIDTIGSFSNIRKWESKTIDTTRKFLYDTTLIYITKPIILTKVSYLPKSIASNKLRGIITAYNTDTLFIKFWHITSASDSYKNSLQYVNSSDIGNYVFVIKNNAWRKSAFKSKFISIPYRVEQIMATNLPFRIITSTGKLETDFLNANVSFQVIYGKTRIYKGEFIKPRNRYWAWGPYAGLSSIDNPVTSEKEFGLNYGLNVVRSIHGLNLIAAGGFQKGFKPGTRQNDFYVGFGIGFKLLETFIPEIKDKNE